MAKRGKKLNSLASAQSRAPVEPSASSESAAEPPPSANRWKLPALLAVALALACGWFLWGERKTVVPAQQATTVHSTTDEAISSGALSAEELTTTLNSAALEKAQAVSAARLDPGQDGWETEVLAETVKARLVHLGEQNIAVDDSALLSGIAEDVRFGTLRPDELVEPSQRLEGTKQLVIRQAADEEEMKLNFQGRTEFLRALQSLSTPFAEVVDKHVHVKVIRVSVTGDSAQTVAYYEADGATADGIVQQRATWHCEWKRGAEDALLLSSIRATDYEEVISQGPWLEDTTAAVLDRNPSYRAQLAYGLNHWLTRLERIRGMHVFTRNGLAVGDVNGDGLEDVYVCQPGGLPNRLYVQQPDGTAVDQSHVAGVDWLEQTSSALLLDLDNDGDQDLVAATVAGLLVMENDGTGKFRLRSTLATPDTDTQSFSAADYDNDGDLDLYVCIEFAKQLTLQYESDRTFVYHNANDGAPNALFRNDIQGDKWEFTNVTQQTGLDADNRRHSLACAWEDFDNDGDQDLYVANDYGHNCLYQNTDGQFKNIAAAANAVDAASGMSVSWGDYDRDGIMDLYVANMFSSAGNRITHQEQFQANADDELREVYSRFAKGNTLLRNNGQGQFEDVGAPAGVEMGRWAWSSVFTDLNNDAWDDLLVANGYITTEDTGDL